MAPIRTTNQIKSLSIQNIFLVFFLCVGLIIFSIISFIFFDAFKAYTKSHELHTANSLLEQTRALNYGLSDELVAATIYLSSRMNEKNQGTEALDTKRQAWLAVHDANLSLFSDVKLKIGSLVSDVENRTLFRQLLMAEKELVITGRDLQSGKLIHPDTLLEAFTAMFTSLDFVRTELLIPQDAGQFAFQQGLLIERVVQSLYDLTVIEGALLTRIISSESVLDEQVLSRLTLLRENASKDREYLDIYQEKISAGKGYFSGDDKDLQSLKDKIEKMEAQFEKLDDVRRKIYASSFLGAHYDITVGQWEMVLDNVLDSIKNVENIVILPAEMAIAKDVKGKTSQIQFMSVASFAVLGLLVILLYFLRRNVLKPIIDITERMTALAQGELDVRLPAITRKDEIARMVKALETFKNTAAEAARLASFPEKNPDPIIELNENGFITYVNPAAAQEFPQISVDAMAHPLFDDFVDLQVESLAETTTIIHEKEVNDKFYERYTTFVKLQDKVLVRIFLRDITKRKEKERALKETQEKAEILLNALETSNTGIVILDTRKENKTVTYVNDSFVRLIGYERAALIGKSYDLWLGKNTDSNVVGNIEKTIETEGHLIAELELCRPDGVPFWVRMRMAPVHAHDGITYIFIINDITEERQQEEIERKQQNMMSIAKMAGGMAHEINNALQPILGLSEAMLKKFELEEQYEADKELAKVIYDYADYARNIVSDMLVFTKQDATQAEELDVVETLKNTLTLSHEAVAKDMALKVSGLGYDEKVEGPLKIKANKTGLFQIFTNLIKNARHAMDDDGTLSVHIGLEKLGLYNTRSLPAGDYVVVSLSDTGHGMDEETQAKVFEPFFSTKEIGKGTGLGLSVIYGIMKNWRGDIFLESKVGVGTTFFLYWPAV